MFASISFTIGSGKIEVSGHSFDLGELTTEILNLPKEIYAEMRHTLETAEHHFSAYERSHELSTWFSGNEEMIRLDHQMMQYHIFRLVKQESSILSEARLYIQQLSLFPEEDHEPTESDMDIPFSNKIAEAPWTNPQGFQRKKKGLTCCYGSSL